VNFKTIQHVVENGLCTGCGTCVSVCPNRAINLTKNKEMQVYLPKLNEERCNGCALCHKVCPGHAVDFKQLNTEICGKKSQSTLENILLGNYINCYTGYSTDYSIRFNSSSGGMVTQLLIFALEEGIIDGALVTRMKNRSPLEPQSFIARTRKEILEASGSKYCPVPANVALREILDQEGKYATVGLPCHIHGLRKAERINKKLKEKIVLHIGLFCSRNDSFLQTEYLLHRLGIRIDDVAKIDYRGKGWPGMLSIKLKSGDEKNCSYLEWITIHEFCLFTPSRCLLCCDGSAELADISFGDAWLPEFLHDNTGRSIIISRTQIAEQFLQKAMVSKKIELSKISGIRVAKSQGMMRFKKNSLAVRFLLFRLSGKETPTYFTKTLKPKFIDYPRSGIIFVNRYLASKRCFWGAIENFIRLQNPLKKTYTIALARTIA
jgi:coenzyme F420 hydrogenase subunit beta